MKNRDIKRYIRIVFWGAMTFVCVIIIFYMSHKPAPESAEMSGLIVEWLLSHGIGIELAEYLDLIVRKCAHMAEYFILTFSVSLLFIYTKESLNLKLRLYAIIFAFLYAVSDEVHQLFIEGRAGKVTDVLVDSVGIGLAFVIITLLINAQMLSIYSANDVEKGL